jgi:hypothetical protein
MKEFNQEASKGLPEGAAHQVKGSRGCRRVVLRYFELYFGDMLKF